MIDHIPSPRRTVPAGDRTVVAGVALPGAFPRSAVTPGVGAHIARHDETVRSPPDRGSRGEHRRSTSRPPLDRPVRTHPVATTVPEEKR